MAGIGDLSMSCKHEHGSGCSHKAAGHIDRPPVGPALTGASILVLRIPDMDCAVEEGAIRRALEKVEGIRRLRFDLPNRGLRIDAPPGSGTASRPSSKKPVCGWNARATRARPRRSPRPAVNGRKSCA